MTQYASAKMCKDLIADNGIQRKGKQLSITNELFTKVFFELCLKSGHIKDNVKKFNLAFCPTVVYILVHLGDLMKW